jgi:hypothetical protein
VASCLKVSQLNFCISDISHVVLLTNSSALINVYMFINVIYCSWFPVANMFWFDQPNDIRWRVKITKIIIM